VLIAREELQSLLYWCWSCDYRNVVVIIGTLIGVFVVKITGICEVGAGTGAGSVKVSVALAVTT